MTFKSLLLKHWANFNQTRTRHSLVIYELLVLLEKYEVVVSINECLFLLGLVTIVKHTLTLENKKLYLFLICDSYVTQSTTLEHYLLC